MGVSRFVSIALAPPRALPIRARISPYCGPMALPAFALPPSAPSISSLSHRLTHPRFIAQRAHRHPIMGLLHTVKVRMPWSPRDRGGGEKERDADAEIARNLWRNYRLLPPNSPRKNVFDWFLLLLVVFNSIEIPFLLVFNLPPDAERGMKNFDIFIDCVFGLDFLRNFVTSYYVDEQIVTSRKQIAMHYITTWMSIDLIALIPWDLIQLEGFSFTFLRVLRLLRCAPARICCMRSS